jgi:hypothetical protein
VPTREAEQPPPTVVLTVGEARLPVGLGKAGRNTVPFKGRLAKGKTLRPGHYTVMLTAGTAGPSPKLTFTIVSSRSQELRQQQPAEKQGTTHLEDLPCNALL